MKFGSVTAAWLCNFGRKIGDDRRHVCAPAATGVLAGGRHPRSLKRSTSSSGNRSGRHFAERFTTLDSATGDIVVINFRDQRNRMLSKRTGPGGKDYAENLRVAQLLA